MRTYILERISHSQFKITEGWEVCVPGVYDYDAENDHYIDMIIKERQNYFDGAWVYFNEEGEVHNLDFNILQKFSDIYDNALYNTKDITLIELARSAYHSYLENPVFLTGNEEKEYVIRKKYRLGDGTDENTLKILKEEMDNWKEERF